MQLQVPWLKPAAWGVAVGAVGTMIIGFSWLGWTLGSTAERVAVERANSAVIVALTPSCVARFMQQPNAAAKLAEFQKIESWKQREFIEAGGWATSRGAQTPNSGVANACAEELAKSKTWSRTANSEGQAMSRVMNGSRAVGLTLAWRFASFRSEGFPLIPTLILAVLILVAVLADVIAPHNPEVGILGDRFHPPAWLAGGSTEHLLGTDHLGRDVLSRLIFGARVSMIVGFTAVLFAGVLGTALGIMSGYLGGWVDQVIMRVTDTWLALPALTFAIFLAAIVGPSEMNIVMILGAVYWTRYARVIRGEVLSLKEREFVRLAIVANCTKWKIMRRHILPNVLNSAIVLGTLMLGVVIVAEAALSFLGVGVPPPKPAWGLMLADGKKGLMAGYWWLTVLPGSCIMLMVLSANLLGDWLRVKLDPQLRQL